MTFEERHARRMERLRNKKPHAAFIVGNYTTPTCEEDALCPAAYYLQIASTLGLYRYDHPELEAFISFDMMYTGHSVLTYLAQTIYNGARYAAGDRAEVPGYFPYERYTVEFREFRNERGSYLRAVVLGIEEEFQALPTPEAEEWLAARGPLIDPCEGL